MLAQVTENSSIHSFSEPTAHLQKNTHEMGALPLVGTGSCLSSVFAYDTSVKETRSYGLLDSQNLPWSKFMGFGHKYRPVKILIKSRCLFWPW